MIPLSFSLLFAICYNEIVSFRLFTLFKNKKEANNKKSITYYGTIEKKNLAKPPQLTLRQR